MPSPLSRTTLAIVLGASEWTVAPKNFPGSQAFTNAACDLKEYLRDSHLFGLPSENLLDLFDTDLHSDEILHTIDSWVKQRLAQLREEGKEANALLFYLVGHADFAANGTLYCLAVQQSSRRFLDVSGIPVRTLLQTFTKVAPQLSQILIFDCCYAASAYQRQGSGAVRQAIEQAVSNTVTRTGKGTFFLCSSGKDVESVIALDDSYPLFSKALLQVLHEGNPQQPDQPFLSLQEVAELTEVGLRNMPEADIPIPEYTSINRQKGDIADVPLFPNLAVSRAVAPHNEGTFLTQRTDDDCKPQLPEYQVPHGGEKAMEQFRQTHDLTQGQQPSNHEDISQPRVMPFSPDPIFHFNMPLNSSGEFHGRVFERTTLISRIRNGGSTSIVGPRRIGKTWLAKYLLLLASNPDIFGPGYRLGYLDASSTQCKTIAGFTARALKALNAFPRQPGDTIGGTLEKLAQVVEDLQIQHIAPVLCIDEFDGFKNNQEFTREFLEGLRSITQEEGLVLITISREPLFDLIVDIVGEQAKTSPFFNIFQTLILKPFDSKDAEKFAQDKGSLAGFTDQERAYLLEYAMVRGPHDEKQWPPLRLQLVGQMLLDDKRAAQYDPKLYRPQDARYWVDFEKRLNEEYQRSVR